MIVYGDRKRTVDPRTLLRHIQTELTGLEHVFPGIVRHERLVAAFIEGGQLAQGLADAEFEARGGDGPSEVQDTAMALVMALARRVAASWTSDFSALPPDCSAQIDALGKLPLPVEVTIRTPEGYAFYAVYPEAYLEAAWELPDHPLVIGLRSIGTSLAAMVAVGAGSGPPLTLRPTGHPFARELKLLTPLPDAACCAVVDEGPGLSGSSFGAVADLLEDRRTTFFPSHDGEPGAQAGEDHRRRWAKSRRLVKSFDDIIAPRLAGWFSDLVGAGELEPLQSGTRRKYLLRTASGEWLLKFAGLGEVGQAKLVRARMLYAAGFTPQPLGLRHGFLIERWNGDARPPDREPLLAQLARYLAFRAQTFPARDGDGAGVRQLREMALHNAAEAGVPLIPPTYDGRIRRVRTDNRMHRAKWLQLPDGRILKTDALDHDDAHDLIGCQDIAWDIAGAGVELELTPDETAMLTKSLAADPMLVAFYRPCYAAFQLGLASFAGDEAHVARYRAAIG